MKHPSTQRVGLPALPEQTRWLLDAMRVESEAEAQEPLAGFSPAAREGDTVRLRACSLQQARCRQHERAALRCLEYLLGSLPLPLLVLNWNLEIVFINREGRSACTDWRWGARRARAAKPGWVPDLPEVILAECAREKKRLAWNPAEGRSARRPIAAFIPVSHPVRQDLSARIERFDPPGGTSAPCFIVRFRRPAPASQPAGRRFEVMASLTPCEREIAQWVARGLTNAKIAHELCKSIPTVKMQLRSVYRKLGVDNRVQLAGLLV